jgi:hypothetical protein
MPPLISISGPLHATVVLVVLVDVHLSVTMNYSFAFLIALLMRAQSSCAGITTTSGIL